MSEYCESAHGTGNLKKIIHALISKKSCPPAKLASAINASRRLLISTQIIGISSNFPYLLRELNASTCEPDVHAVLAANAIRMIKIRMVVVDFCAVLAVELATNLPLRIKIKMAPINNMNFDRLKKPIGKATDAASVETRSSRKLKVVLSKMVVIVVAV